MLLKTVPLELFTAVNAFDCGKWATNTLLIWGKVLVQVLVKLSQLSLPFATIFAVGTIYMELVQGLFQPLVGKNIKKTETYMQDIDYPDTGHT